MDSISQSDSGGNKWLILISIMIGTFMAVLDATVVNTGLPVIMGTLGASINRAEWILTGYMLAIAAILPAAAWMSNRYGYKRIYIFSILLFTFGSLMCGNSTTIDELIFWRVIEGLGCGAIMPVGMAIVSNVFPVEQRGTALGFWAVASAASVSFGPSIGGYLVDNFNWNYIFYVNVPIGVICIFLSIILIREYKLPVAQRFDVMGFITSSIFLSLFMYGLAKVNSATNAQGWNSPVVLGSMWISAVMFALFVYFELTVKHPLINLRIFKYRNFSTCNIMLFIFGVGMFGSTFLIPLYLQNNLGYTALQAGMFFIPVGFIQGFSSPIAGMLSRKVNPKFLISLGLLLMAISFYINAFLSLQTERWYVMMSLCLRGLGMGLLFTPLLTVAISNISKEVMAEASSITNIVRQMGGSFGVAIFSHVLTSRTIFHTQRYGEAIDYTGEAYSQTINSLATHAQIAVGTSSEASKNIAEQLILRHVDTEAYIGGVNDDFYIAFIITLLCIVPLFWLRIKKSKTNTP